MSAVDAIMALFAEAGEAAYFGEAVSQAEHALQSAHLAAGAGADDELVVAALLHDIGHMLSGLPEDVAQHGIDDTHEEAGAAGLNSNSVPRSASRFGYTLTPSAIYVRSIARIWRACRRRHS